MIKDLSSAFGAVSGGLAGGSAANAQIGAVAGQNAVENNWLGSSTYRRNLAEQAKKGSQEALQLLEIENKLKRYGIADFEALAEEYEKCNGCKSAVAKYQAARNKADAQIVDLIQKGVLTDAELTLLQSKSSERVSAIRKSGYGNMVANAEVKAQADILDFILDARMQRDGVKLTPNQEIGMTLLAGGYGNTPKGSVKPIFTATNQQKTAKNTASSQSRSVNTQEQSHTQALDETYFKQQYGSENVQSGGGNRLETRERVGRNVQETRTHRSQTELARVGQLANELKKGKLPGTPIGNPGTPRTMPASQNPNATAEKFALTILGRTPTQAERIEGAKMNNNNCIGCWRARALDGSMVIYRPAGYAGKDTLPTTATTEIHHSATLKNLNNGRDLKLKFPTK
ncbi:hypothetical protein EGK75_13330 [Neisseria weixii]|uniref:VENN motif-containing domain-containing protein n=1 Tax=Neisseria weixii TaxID=1853276 RepID=A0A3N4MHV4_9NEIS|nr:hypothetical protein EGK74_13205 [Neisseria weixii]RPD83357.1 hypothetical protein EGK75_13330 [Neisseria weixii]